MIMFLMDEENVAMGLRHPRDVLHGRAPGREAPSAGLRDFPRILGRYVRERKDLTLEEAVRKMTFFPAQRFGLLDRGLIAEGRAADIVIFEPETVLDRATYEDPRQFPEGMRHVLVNGVHSVEEGRFTGKARGESVEETRN